MKSEKPNGKLSTFEWILLLLSVYILGQMAVEVVFSFSQSTIQVLRWIDFFVCLVFLADVFWRFYKAENKLRFWKWGWVDLIASIPMLPWLRWARVFRVFRLLRAFRSFRILSGILFKKRSTGSLTVVGIFSVLTLIFASIAITSAEKRVEGANIVSLEDGFWWALTTMTTVGYGDRYPVTSEGRIIAAVLMGVGVGLFGTFTAAIAAYMVEDDAEKEEQKLEERLNRLEKKLDQLLKAKDQA